MQPIKRSRKQNGGKKVDRIGSPVITKNISNDTKKILDDIIDLDIFPDYSEKKNANGTWKITMKKYPFALGQYIDSLNEDDVYGRDVKESDILVLSHKIYDMIDRLHEHGILHGDLHAENIVLDPETNDIKIIDFEDKYVKKIDTIDEADIKKIVTHWNTDKEINTVDELKLYERNMWKIGYINE
jgi:hypothetical protein